jgi:hypothetical protein
MRQLLKKLILDQHGMIVSSEIVLVGTILVLGTIVGLASLSHAVTHELNDVAQACDNTYKNPHSPNSPRDYTITNSTGVPEVVGY